MQRRNFCKLALAATASAVAKPRPTFASTPPAPRDFVLDMVHFNPGEPAPHTRFLDPTYLKQMGYTGQVLFSNIEGVPTFSTLFPNLLDETARTWATQAAAVIEKKISAARAANLPAYAWMQLTVFPKALVARERAGICNAKGQIDVELPRTQQLIAAQLDEIFARFPQLDGLVIRTGEVYMQDLPHHASSGNTAGTELIQESTSILNGPASHIALLRVLRERACLRGKRIFYRTWDFGPHFHNNPDYYLRVTDAIEPHPNLIFSIKHQQGDFHQLTPFNPTLTLGRHRQIVEVQCQREAYGKGAHPYYIGQGVITGWEDMAWVNPAGRPKGLADIIANPLIAGVWTWSRGGGWQGPFIKNEFWCALNAAVVSHYAENPTRSEPALLNAFARQSGLPAAQLAAFRELNLLSAKGVLRGQLTALRVPVATTSNAPFDVWWTRDDKIGVPNLTDFLRLHLIDASIAEKREAVAIWQRIEAISQTLTFADSDTTAFVRSSCTYGRMKYAIIAAGWTAYALGLQGKADGSYNRPAIQAAIADWDKLWAEWKHIAATDPWCSTLYKPQAFDVHFQYRPGLGAAVDALRPIAAS
jgi:hypothetical protein